MGTNKPLALVVILAAAGLFYATLVSDLNGIAKFFVSLVIMAGCGLSLQSLLGIDGQFGLLLLRTTKGLRYIDNVANAAPRLWQACADFGIVLGFGMSSVFFFKEPPKKTFMFSMLALILVSQLMTTKVFEVVVELISIPIDLSSVSGQMGETSPLVPLLVILAMLFFGLCGVTVVGLVLNTYTILSKVFGFLFNVPGADLSDAIPGASPVIPGINMPLFEGIIALGVLLFIHEVSHGILSRIGKVKLESAGLLLFGLIPVGAFGDPDEKSLEAKDVDTQTRVFAAGSASNLIVFILAFFALASFESITAPQLEQGVYVNFVEVNSSAYAAGMVAGERLVSVDSVPVAWENIGSLSGHIANAEKVSLKTDRGDYSLVPTASQEGGKKSIGIAIPNTQPYSPQFSWLGFIKNTLGLIFVLNFLVGVINLIPLFQAFDGYRIVSLHMKNRALVGAISLSLLLMFLLNFLPWVWM